MPGALFLVVFAAYLKTAAGTASYDDSGELCVAALGEGILHPPGYPLLTLLARLCGHIPVGSTAYRLSVLAALGAAGSVCVLFCLWRSIFPRHQLAGWTAMLLTGLSLWAWSQAGVAKGAVYSFNSLLTVGVLAGVLGLRRQPSRLMTISAAAGLGLANHWMSIIGLMPALAWAIGTRARNLRNGLLAGIGLALGLSLYCTLPVISSGGPFLNWERPRTFGGFRSLVIREQYSSTFQETAPLRERLGNLGAALEGTAPLWPLLVFAFAGAVTLWAGRAGAMTSTLLFLVLLYGSLLLYGPMRSGAHWYFGIFSISGGLVVSFLALAGLIGTLGRITERWCSSLALILLAIYGISEIPGRWQINDRSREYLTHDLARNLAALAEGPSLILANSDVVVFGNWHAWRVQGQNGSLFAVPAPLLPQPWVALSFGKAVRGIKAPYPAPWADTTSVPRLLEAWRKLNAPRFGVYSFKTPEIQRSEAGISMLPTGLAFRLGERKGEKADPAEWRRSARKAFRMRARGLVGQEIARTPRATATFQPLYFAGLLAWGNGLMDHSHAGAERILNLAAALTGGREDRALLALALGNLAIGTGSVERGVGLYREAAAGNPCLAAAWLNIAYARLRQGREEEAVAALKRLKQAVPDSAESREAEEIMRQLERRAGSER